MENPVEKLAMEDGRYSPKAFMIVLEALHMGTPEKRHISGAELSHAVLELVRGLYGVSARMVLHEWGLKTTRDIGEVVFLLVNGGIMRAAPGDRIEDFDDLFDLSEQLEENYPWGSR